MRVFGSCISALLAAAALFGILQWLQVPAGSALDWLVGGLSFAWLVAVTVVPWNVHFEAKGAIAEAAESDRRGLKTDPQDVAYLALLARRSLWVALALHGLSVLVLLALAIFGISGVGYLGSIVALLLTGLRPAVRLYGYVAQRVSAIRQTLRYPREDVFTLREKVDKLEGELKALMELLDFKEETSWGSGIDRQIKVLSNTTNTLRFDLQTATTEAKAERDRIEREATEAITQFGSYSDLVDRARLLVRFIKEA